MESYDRLFPNQDTLPKGGFGKMNEDEVKQFIYKHGERGLFNNDNIIAGSED
ncbi:hypothetical protein D3C76_1880790 [compost metagenome]